jgi:hypothetical protein
MATCRRSRSSDNLLPQAIRRPGLADRIYPELRLALAKMEGDGSAHIYEPTSIVKNRECSGKSTGEDWRLSRRIRRRRYCRRGVATVEERASRHVRRRHLRAVGIGIEAGTVRVGRKPPAMNTAQWQTAWQIFNAARELPIDEQRRFVEAQSADPEIVQRVFVELEALREVDGKDGRAIAPEIDRTGVRVGRYRVASLLGRGGMGEVYRAHDTDLDRAAALKFLRREAIGNSAAGGTAEQITRHGSGLPNRRTAVPSIISREFPRAGRCGNAFWRRASTGKSSQPCGNGLSLLRATKFTIFRSLNRMAASP